MLSPVSMASVQPRVHFGEGPLDRKGAYASDAAQEAAAATTSDDSEEKKSSTGKKIAIAAAVVVAVAAALALGKKFDLFKILEKEDLAKTKWYQPSKWGHYLGKAGEAIIEYCYRKPKNWITGLFKSENKTNPKPNPEQPTSAGGAAA